MNKTDEFQIENNEVLNLIKENSASLNEYDYFLDLSKNYYIDLFRETNKPRLLLIDTLFPIEIIKALGIDYQYIFGGSFKSTNLRKFILPKKVNDETKSVLGFLENINIKKDDVILIPLTNDNNRKLYSILNGILKVITYEIPNNKTRYINEINRVTKRLKNHFKKHLSTIKLKKECLLSKKCANAFIKFENLFNHNPSISLAMYLFISNSFYYDKNKSNWYMHLEKLVSEILNNKNFVNKSKDSKAVLLGSSIYFPNYKIPAVLEAQNIGVSRCAYQYVENIKNFINFRKKMVSIKKIALQYFSCVGYPNFSNEEIIKLISKTNCKIVISIIHKGQIDNSEQFIELEKTFDNKNVSFNKIETTFNYQDIEQIETKCEAISEINKL